MIARSDPGHRQKPRSKFPVPIREDLSARQALDLWRRAGISAGGGRRAYRRQYMRLLMRAQREDLAYRVREAARKKQTRNRDRDRRTTAAWRARHRRHLLAYDRAYNALRGRDRLCQTCGKKGKRGLGGVMPVRAQFIDLQGNTVIRKMQLCGSCRKRSLPRLVKKLAANRRLSSKAKPRRK